jgi:polysaccharide export outer membrane protein
MNQIYTCVLVLLIGFGYLCGPAALAQKKPKIDDVTYFQPVGNDTVSIRADSLPVFRIQPGTELNIMVASLNPDIDALLNPRFPIQNAMNNVDSKQIAGYIVDEKGVINFPMVGRVNVLNLTTHQAADVLVAQLSRQVNNPFVTVRVANFQVTVLGEVGHPVVLNVSRERLTLPEAISLAGDLTIFGKRENVLVVRQRESKREFGRVNLQDRSVFRSAYYHLQPNDMVYVEPKRSKKVQAGRVFPFLPVIFSGASLLITLGLALFR